MARVKRTRVMLIDANKLERRRVRRTLETTGAARIVAEAGSPTEAIGAMEPTAPDVLLMRVSPLGPGEVDATSAALGPLRQVPRVLMIPPGPQRDTIGQRYDGALGFVAAETADNDIVPAVRCAAAGKAFVSPALAAHVATANGEPLSTDIAYDPVDYLTRRERIVLDLLAEGKAPKEIAAELGRSAATIRNHHAHILAKLRLRNDVELGRFLAERSKKSEASVD